MEINTDNQPLRLNSSSIASSTPGNYVSSPTECQFLNFQEFKDHQKSSEGEGQVSNLAATKKNLTIDIDESYAFQPSANVSRVSENPRQSHYEEESPRHTINPHLETQTNRPKEVKQKSHFAKKLTIDCEMSSDQSQVDIRSTLEAKNSQLNNIVLTKTRQNTSLKQEVTFLKNLLEQEQRDRQSQRAELDCMAEKLYGYENVSMLNTELQQKLKQKEAKMQQLQRKVDKLAKMNKSLQNELKESDKKIMELEKDHQKVICQNHHEALTRIKESSVRVKEASLRSKDVASNKENFHPASNNCQIRKSIDKKKVPASQSQGKKKPAMTATMRGQRVSSSSNIGAKKLIIHSKKD